MSWDAALTCDHCGSAMGERDWNYTHNTNRMVNLALVADGKDWGDESWWKVLDGMNGGEGAELLDAAIQTLEANPERFRAMNPENGWGSYDTLLPVLRQMLDASDANPDARWTVLG